MVGAKKWRGQIEEQGWIERIWFQKAVLNVKAAVRLEQSYTKKTNIGATKSANNGPASVLSPDKCFAEPSGTLTHGGRGVPSLYL